MFWTCSFHCMFRTLNFLTFAFCDLQYMFHVPICHSFSMFPLRALCFTFSLFSDSAVSTSPYLIVFSLMFSVPFVSRPIVLPPFPSPPAHPNVTNIYHSPVPSLPQCFLHCHACPAFSASSHISRTSSRVSRTLSRVSHASCVFVHSIMLRMLRILRISYISLTPVIVRSCRFSPPIPLAYI